MAIRRAPIWAFCVGGKAICNGRISLLSTASSIRLSTNEHYVGGLVPFVSCLLMLRMLMRQVQLGLIAASVSAVALTSEA